MTAEEAINWYLVGLGAMLGIAGGPLLVIVVSRWAKSFLGV